MTDLGGTAAAEESAGGAGAGLAAGHALGREALQELVEAGSDWLWETDADLRFSWVSDGYQAATGIAPSQVLGRFRFDFLKQAPKGSRSAAAHLDDLQARRPFRDFVYPLKGGRAGCRWISTTGFPRFDTDGNFIGYRGMGRNVTAMAGALGELEKATDEAATRRGEDAVEEALERSRLAEAVLNGVRDPVFVKDDGLRFVFVNEAFSSAYGVTPQAMIGKSAADFLTPDEAVAFEENENAVLATGETFEEEQDCELAGIGRVVRKNRIRTESGRDYVAGFIFDVSDMKRREAEAEDARQHLAERAGVPAGRACSSTTATTSSSSPTSKLGETLPALKPVWQPGRTFREALEIRRMRPAISATATIRKSTGSTTRTRSAGVDAMLARYRQAHNSTFERQDAGGPLAPGLRHAHRRRHLHRRARRHHGDQEPRSGAARFDAPDRSVPARDGRVAGGGLHQGRGPQHRVRQQGMVRADRPCQGRRRSAAPTASCSAPEDAESYSSDDTEVGVTGEVSEVEEPVTHRDGTVRQLMTRKSRLVAIDGSVHLVGSSTDITEVKARERALEESMRENEVFRSLIDNVPVSIYAKRSDLRQFYVNKGWCDLTGFSKEEAIGKTDIEIFGSGWRGFRRRRPGRAAHRRDAGDRGDRDRLADGSVRHQFARKGAMIASDGSLYLIGSTTDITELKQREAELQRGAHSAPCSPTAPSRNSWPI